MWALNHLVETETRAPRECRRSSYGHRKVFSAPTEISSSRFHQAALILKSQVGEPKVGYHIRTPSGVACLLAFLLQIKHVRQAPSQQNGEVGEIVTMFKLCFKRVGAPHVSLEKDGCPFSIFAFPRRRRARPGGSARAGPWPGPRRRRRAGRPGRACLGGHRPTRSPNWRRRCS